MLEALGEIIHPSNNDALRECPSFDMQQSRSASDRLVFKDFSLETILPRPLLPWKNREDEFNFSQLHLPPLLPESLQGEKVLQSVVRARILPKNFFEDKQSAKNIALIKMIAEVAASCREQEQQYISSVRDKIARDNTTQEIQNVSKLKRQDVEVSD